MANVPSNESVPVQHPEFQANTQPPYQTDAQNAASPKTFGNPMGANHEADGFTHDQDGNPKGGRSPDTSMQADRQEPMRPQQTAAVPVPMDAQHPATAKPDMELKPSPMPQSTMHDPDTYKDTNAEYPPLPGDEKNEKRSAALVAEPTDVEVADKAVAEAEQKAQDARAEADKARWQAATDAQARADEAEAKQPKWQTILENMYDRTEILVLDGGYFLRSTWRHLRSGSVGGDPLTGSSVTFVPGDAPPLVTAGVLALTVPDLKSGVDPERATIADVHPIRQLETSAEVIMWLPDGRIKVLRSRDQSKIGVVRDATPADGKAPVKE